MTDHTPLPPRDANGALLRVGTLVSIPPLPDWLTHDLPQANVERLRAMEGRVMPVREIDAYGYIWFGVHSPWFCLRPSEVHLAGHRENAV